MQTVALDSYAGFSESTAKNSLRYFFYLVSNLFVLLMILMIPALFQLPNTIESYIDTNVDTLRIDLVMKTTEPILIPKENPVLLINYANKTPTQTANVIINNDKFYTGFLMQQITKDISVYRNAKENKTGFSNLLAIILLMMVPTLLLVFYFYLLIKYAAIVLLATLAGTIIAILLRYRIETKKVFNCAIYGSSLTVLLDILFFSFSYSFYHIQYLPLVIYVISGIIINGTKIDSKKKNKYYEIKG